MMARYVFLFCVWAAIAVTIRMALWGPLDGMDEDTIGQDLLFSTPQAATRRGSSREARQLEEANNKHPFTAAFKKLKDQQPTSTRKKGLDKFVERQHAILERKKGLQKDNAGGDRAGSLEAKQEPIPQRPTKRLRRPKTKEQVEMEREVASLNNTYFRQLHPSRLTVCTPRKVASSATNKILAKWKLLPPIKSSQRNPKFDKGTYRFAILRDPLERLYSGYHNKCLFQRETEPDQCPGFPNARQDPPSLETFLRKVRSDSKPFYANPHFSPQSRQCPPSRFDQVFRMSSPTFNPEVAQLWLDLGAPLQWIEHDFPLNATQKHQQHSYHANAADKVAEEFNCELLILALPLLRRDYQGDYKEHSPFPEWAANILKEPECIKIREGRLQKIRKAKQQKEG